MSLTNEAGTNNFTLVVVTIRYVAPFIRSIRSENVFLSLFMYFEQPLPRYNFEFEIVKDICITKLSHNHWYPNHFEPSSVIVLHVTLWISFPREICFIIFTYIT